MADPPTGITEAISTQAITTQPISITPIPGPGVYQGGSYGISPPRRPGVLPPARHRHCLWWTVGLPTSANPEAPIEASGSLTGLILSRGESGQIRAQEQRSRMTKVLAVGLGAIAFVTVIAIIGRPCGPISALSGACWADEGGHRRLHRPACCGPAMPS
jgi:hypothetical protein